MAKLAGEQVFLLLTRTQDLRGHEVRVVSNFSDALQSWDATTRSSPIFPLDNATFPRQEPGSSWYLFFIGPVDIGTLDLDGTRSFATYGIHNLLITTSVEHDPAVLKVLTQVPNSPWEAWTVCGTRVIDVAYSPNLINDHPPPGLHSSATTVPTLPAQLKSASEEYRTLIAVTRAKCERYLPTFVGDIEQFDRSFKRALLQNNQHSVTKLAWLANVNAALSRFSSQTFAGTSPILETECHFWTHSFLGVGTATQALTNIRRHHDSALGASRLAEKIAALGNESAGPANLMQLSFSHPAWSGHKLAAVSLPVIQDDEKPQDFLKLIAYFSGRDGYRSTSFTLSAPLELITGCNTYAWTPLTLTHELSHTITNLVLGTLLRGVESSATQSKLAKLVSPKAAYEPANAFEQAQKALVTAFVFLDREGLPDSANFDSVLEPHMLLPLIGQHHDEMSELVTHLIDFQYFYGRDVSLYMTSLWESWDVIPNIQSRIDEYLVRTLVAVLSIHQHVADPLDATYQVVLLHLKTLVDRSSESQYIAAAHQRLSENLKYFRERMHRRVPVVKLMLAFIYDPVTAGLIARETPSAGGEYSTFRQDELDLQQIRNPLKFISRFAADRNPNSRKSLWMLHKLAFAEAS
ncbi:hypothetical protein ACFY89_15545 [Achromobacter spanius]|uniref:hypothetical protein n=1 Tax=Achromobacter spanius TaxID=217203 RepID=UPI0036E183DA